jgi:hypothetical protein
VTFIDGTSGEIKLESFLETLLRLRSADFVDFAGPPMYKAICRLERCCRRPSP